jgi:signal transduction histidine kinase
LWIAATLVALILFAAGISDRYDQLRELAFTNERILADIGLSATYYAAYFVALDTLLVVTHIAIAGLIYWQGSDNVVAVLVALALVTAPLAAIEALSSDIAGWQFVGKVILYVGLVASTTLLYVFPDGRFVPGWTRPLAMLWAVINIPAVFFSATIFSLVTWPTWLQFAILAAWSTTGIYAQVFRYIRVSNPVERQQTKWAMLGLVAATLGPIGHYFGLLTLPSLSQTAPPGIFYNLADPTVFQFATVFQIVGLSIYTFALLLFPLSFAIAILRYRLFDIQIVLNRTLVFAGLTALIVAIYVLVVGGLGALFQAQGSLLLAVFAAGLIAVLFDPLRARFQLGVNRFMYGYRDDPVGVVTRLGEKLEGTIESDSVSSTIIETIAQALRLPYVAIQFNGSPLDQRGREEKDPQALPTDEARLPRIEYGQPVDDFLAIPLTYQDENIGRLLVSPRAQGEDFSSGDLILLDSIAHQAAAALRTVGLTSDLQRSREKLVTALEEERRQLRRDLHDHLGAQLAALTLQADFARRSIGKDADSAAIDLESLKESTKTTMAEIRRLVRDLDHMAVEV